MFNFWPFKRKVKEQPRWIMIPSFICYTMPVRRLGLEVFVPQEIHDWIDTCCPEAYLVQHDGCKSIHFPDDESMLQFELTFNSFRDWRNDDGVISHP